MMKLTNSARTEAPACPMCGKTNVSFGWDAPLRIRFTGGGIESVDLGPSLGSPPTEVICDDCGVIRLDPSDGSQRAQVGASLEIIDSQLPGSLVQDLRGGALLYSG